MKYIKWGGVLITLIIVVLVVKNKTNLFSNSTVKKQIKVDSISNEIAGVKNIDSLTV